MYERQTISSKSDQDLVYLWMFTHAAHIRRLSMSDVFKHTLEIPYIVWARGTTCMQEAGYDTKHTLRESSVFTTSLSLSTGSDRRFWHRPELPEFNLVIPQFRRHFLFLCQCLLLGYLYSSSYVSIMHSVISIHTCGCPRLRTRELTG